MVYRLSWLAGLAGIGLALVRLERLLLASLEGLAWEVVIAAAAVLGAATTWIAVAYLLRGRTVVALNSAGALLAVFRIAVPATTWGIFPTAGSFGALRLELDYAREVIRAGIAPVLASAGVVAVAAVVFWALGAVLVWGLTHDHPYVAVIPPLIVYLQFATMDRAAAGLWSWVFLTVLGLALLGVAHDRRRRGAGAVTTGSTRLAVVRSVPSLAVATLAVTLGLAVLSTSAVSGLVPSSGLLEWRVNSSLTGGYYGSVSYNPFVSIRQRLVSQSDVPIFVAEISGDLQWNELYWRLVTLDGFDGTQWYLAEGSDLVEAADHIAYEDPELAFRGPAVEVTQSVVILALQQDWIPAVYAPQRLTAGNPTVERGFQIKTDDASLRFESLSFRGMTYQVLSEVPRPDLADLSRGADGRLSPLFAAARRQGAFVASEDGVPPIRLPLPAADRYLDLPDEYPMTAVADLAIAETRGLATEYERALALESFFRSRGSFSYTTDIDAGHAASDLTAWLLDPQSSTYRRGYCEQFATAMAVMARQVGIPSRVVLGFAPARPQEDGRVVIRDRNAHAWVELWMPSQGWVRFDPTPRGDGINPSAADQLPFSVSRLLEESPETTPQAPLSPASQRPSLDPGLSDLDLDGSPGLPGGRPDSAPKAPGWIPFAALAGLAAIGSVPAAKWARRRARLRRLRKGDVGAAWREVVDRLSDLGWAPDHSQTPAEYAGSFDDALAPLADVYTAAVYGPPPVPGEHPGRVAAAERSFSAAERYLRARFSVHRRLAACYRLSSLIHSRWFRPAGRNQDLG